VKTDAVTGLASVLIFETDMGYCSFCIQQFFIGLIIFLSQVIF